MSWTSKTPLEKGEMDKNALECKFDELLIAAIDEELSSLGGLVKNLFYAYLENNFCISRYDFPARIEDFSKALDRFFGICVDQLEIRFMKSLYLRLEVEFEFPEVDFNEWIKSGFSFAGYLNYMKRNFENHFNVMKY